MADQSTPYRDLSTPFRDLHGYGSSVENTPASDASAFSMDSSADLPSSGFLNDPSRFFDASANSQFSPPVSLSDASFLEASSFDINTDDPFLTSFSEQHTDFTNRLQFPQHSDGEDELYSSPSVPPSASRPRLSQPPITTIAPAGLPRQPLPAAPQVELSGGMSPLTPGSSSDRDSDRDSDGEQVGGGKYVDREEPLTPTRFREVVRPTERDQGLVRDATKRRKSAAQTAQSAPTDTMPPPPPPPPLPSDGPQTRRVLKKRGMLRADSPSADHVRSSTPPRVKSGRKLGVSRKKTAPAATAVAPSRAAKASSSRPKPQRPNVPQQKASEAPSAESSKKASEAPSAGSSKNAGLHKQPPKLILPPQPPAQAQDGRWVRSSGFLGSGRRGEKNVLARSSPPPPPPPVATPPPAPIVVAPPPPNIAAPPPPVIAAPPLPIAAAPPAPVAAALPLPDAAAAPLSVAAGSPQPNAAPPPINERRTPIPPERFIGAIDEFVAQGEFVSVSMASPPPDWVAEHTKPPSTPPMTALDANDEDDFVPNLVDPDADASDGLDVFEEDPESDFDDESPNEAASRTAMEIEELGERIKGKVIFPPFFPPPPMPPLTTPQGGRPTNDEQARVRRCFERMMAAVSRAVNSTGFSQTHIIKGFLQYAGGFKHAGTNLWNIYQIYANTLENRLAETQRLHPNFVWPPPPSGAPDANIEVDEFPPKLFPEELSITFKKFKTDYPDSWRDILCAFDDVHTAETLESAAERENHFHSKMDKVHGSLDAFNRAHGFEGLVVAVGCHMHEDAHIWDFYKTPGLEEFTTHLGVSEADLLSAAKLSSYAHHNKQERDARAAAGAPKLEDPDKIKSEPASEPTRLPRRNLKNLPEQERVAAVKEATKIRHTTLGSTRNGMLDDAIEASIADVGFNVWADPKKPGAMVWTVIGSHLAAAGVRLLGWDATVRLPPQMESKRGKSGLWKEEVAALRNALNARSISGAGLRYEKFTYRAGDPVFVTHDYTSVPPDAKSPDFVAHWRTSIKRLPYIDGEDHMFVGQYDLRGIGPPSESRTPLYPPTLPADASDDDASDIEEIPPPARTSKHAPKTNAAAPAKSKSKSGDAAAKSKVSGKSNSKTKTKSADALPAKSNSRKRTAPEVAKAAKPPQKRRKAAPAPEPESDNDELELESEEEEDFTATPVVTRSKSRSGTQVGGGVVPSEPLRLPTASVPTPIPVSVKQSMPRSTTPRRKILSQFIDGTDVEVDTDYDPLADNRDTRPKRTRFQDAELSGDSGRDESYMPPVPPDQPKKRRRTAAPETSGAPDAHPELLPRPPPPQRYPVARPAYRGATASSRTAPSAPGSRIQPVASGSGQALGSRIPPVTSASTLQQRRPPYEVNGRLVRDPRDPPEGFSSWDDYDATASSYAVQNDDQRPRRPPRPAPPPVDLTAVQQALVNNPDAAQLLMSMFMPVLQGAAPPQNYGGDYDEYAEYEYTDGYPPNR